MKQLLLTGILAISLIACNNNETNEAENENDALHETVQTNYTVNTEESILNWKGSMIGVYAHEGTMTFKESTLSVKNGKVISGSFTVDMNTMLTTDDDALYVNSPREKLIGHLQAEDFFATETWPTSSFTFKSMEGDEIKGDLTIRGITNSENVTDLIISEENGLLSATGNLIFDRQKYDVKYENMMGDMVLSDDIELTISLKGKSK